MELWAEAANPRWIGDVHSRRLRIANGEGTVHWTGIILSLNTESD